MAETETTHPQEPTQDEEDHHMTSIGTAANDTAQSSFLHLSSPNRTEAQLLTENHKEGSANEEHLHHPPSGSSSDEEKSGKGKRPFRQGLKAKQYSLQELAEGVRLHKAPTPTELAENGKLGIITWRFIKDKTRVPRRTIKNKLEQHDSALANHIEKLKQDVGVENIDAMREAIVSYLNVLTEQAKANAKERAKAKRQTKLNGMSDERDMMHSGIKEERFANVEDQSQIEGVDAQDASSKKRKLEKNPRESMEKKRKGMKEEEGREQMVSRIVSSIIPDPTATFSLPGHNDIEGALDEKKDETKPMHMEKKTEDLMQLQLLPPFPASLDSSLTSSFELLPTSYSSSMSSKDPKKKDRRSKKPIEEKETDKKVIQSLREQVEQFRSKESDLQRWQLELQQREIEIRRREEEVLLRNEKPKAEEEHLESVTKERPSLDIQDNSLSIPMLPLLAPHNPYGTQ